MELLWPTDIVPNVMDWAWVDSTAVYNSPTSGASRTVSRPGMRLVCTMTFTGLTAAKRAKALAAVSNLRGRSNRIWLTDETYKRRGTFPVSELLPNNTFTNGIVGLGSQNATLTNIDGSIRIEGQYPQATVPGLSYTSPPPTVAQYVPYAMRSMMRLGKGFSAATYGPYLDSGGNAAFNYKASPGISTTSVITLATSAGAVPAVANQTSGWTAGDYAWCDYVSLARCALVDGSPNALLQSDLPANAVWSKVNCTVGTVAAGPTNLTDAYPITENTTPTVSHYVTQTAIKSAVNEDWCGYIEAKANGRTLLRLVIGDNATNYSECTFDLTTGNVSSISNIGTGTFARSGGAINLGNGWWGCWIVAKVAAAITTTNTFAYYLKDGTGASTYTGNGTSGVLVRRAGYSVGGVASMPSQTTTTAITNVVQSGIGINIKGLPGSVANLLMPGDWIDVNGQLNMVTSPLTSNAAGMGYLQVARPFTTPPTNNTPVVIQRPMGRFILAQEETGWSSMPGVFSEMSLSFVEDIA
ncbi:hypothetical protein UFOVP605_54 [uncultured Caudovirales phage]|uniref:Uncharacterized protein n=1 Tax=uncultured Caudovirales phage TaxID=2100421 RepID=A0A6J5NCS1_9CAUD|nr:hypothetical protein UFOVP605_54 [uncultured Caudovirales phage]